MYRLFGKQKFWEIGPNAMPRPNQKTGTLEIYPQFSSRRIPFTNLQRVWTIAKLPSLSAQ